MGFLFPNDEWQNPAHYSFIYELHRAGVAWEFLRRDSTYQGYLGADPLIAASHRGPAIIPRELGSAESWGLSFCGVRISRRRYRPDILAGRLRSPRPAHRRGAN